MDNGILPALDSEPIQSISGEQIRVIGLGIHGSERVEAHFIGRGERDMHLIGNRQSHISLQREHIPHLAFIALGPDVLIGGGVDQLGRHPDLLPGCQDRSLHDVIRPQFPGDLGEGFLAVFISHGGSPGNHPQRIELGEIGN